MKLTKAEIKAILARCEQHTGVRESKSLKSAKMKIAKEINSWPVKSDLCPAK